MGGGDEIIVVVATGGSSYKDSLSAWKLAFTEGFETARKYSSTGWRRNSLLFGLPKAEFKLVLGDIGKEEDIR